MRSVQLEFYEFIKCACKLVRKQRYPARRATNWLSLGELGGNSTCLLGQMVFLLFLQFLGLKREGRTFGYPMSSDKLHGVFLREQREKKRQGE